MLHSLIFLATYPTRTPTLLGKFSPCTLYALPSPPILLVILPNGIPNSERRWINFANRQNGVERKLRVRVSVCV